MQVEFPLNLSVSPKDAAPKLQARIEAGQSLHDLSIDTQNALVQAQVNLKIWCKENRNLLLELFRTSSEADEYKKLCEKYPITSSSSAPALSSVSASSAKPEFSRTSNIIREVLLEHIEKLTNIRDGIMLHCEDSDFPQRKVGNNKMTENSTNTLGNDVFIVHGRNEEAKVKVARFVEKLEITATILHEQADLGRTIIEKFEAHASDAGFAIVILTPDDIGGQKGTNQINPRSRQNVILELGYFLGKLGRRRVCVLHKEKVELPSDIHGILYIPMDNADGWQQKLAREMNKAGLPIDMNKLLQ